MRRALAVLLLVLGVLVAGVSTPGRHASAAATDLHSIRAVGADLLVDSYGIGIHLAFLDTPYRDPTAVADALSDLGVRHVRDDLFLDNPRQYAGIAEVAARGIGFDLIMGRPGGAATPSDYVDTVATQLPAGAVESLEGVNEWDISQRSEWVAEMKAWQQGLYTAARAEPATADLPVLAPALAFRWNYPAAGDLSGHADLANGHMYPGGYRPMNEVTRITDAIRGSIPDAPLVTTEAGYHNALNTSHGHRAVPEDVAGVYLPRLLLEHWLRGERRVYSYELIDEFDDPGLTDPEAHFGLLRHDLTPKPAYFAMRTLLGLLADPGPSFSPETLSAAVDRLPHDGRWVLAQKRDGRFVLLLWRDVTIYDPVEQLPTPVMPTDVTLRLGRTAGLTVYRPSQGSVPVLQSRGSSLQLQLDGQVTAIEIDAAAVPAPTGLTSTAGNASATVRWQAPPGADELTGFEVVRQPGDVRFTVGATARSFEDTRLVNGTPYHYTVQTLTSQGRSVAVSAPEVIPATTPGRPGIRRVRPGSRSVTVRWRYPVDGGRPVTAFRLKTGQRTVDVSAGSRRATITRLAPGRRLRVGVRARNAVGWGPLAYTRYVTIR